MHWSAKEKKTLDKEFTKARLKRCGSRKSVRGQNVQQSAKIRLNRTVCRVGSKRRSFWLRNNSHTRCACRPMHISSASHPVQIEKRRCASTKRVKAMEIRRQCSLSVPSTRKDWSMRTRSEVESQAWVRSSPPLLSPISWRHGTPTIRPLIWSRMQRSNWASSWRKGSTRRAITAVNQASTLHSIFIARPCSKKAGVERRFTSKANYIIKDWV